MKHMATDEQSLKSTSRCKRLVRPSLIFVLLLPLAVALLPSGCGSPDKAPPESVEKAPPPANISGPAQHVGSASCTECHAQQHKDWHGSHHDLAMDLATPDKVRGDFNNASFVSKFGVKSSMTRKGDEFFFKTEGRTGSDETFKVKYVFGVDPLQQYLVEFSDGRVQCWNIAWDTNHKKWFDLYQNNTERYRHDDVMHWTGWANTWNHMCAECHSTNLQRNFDQATNTYHTTFSEIDVSCEACHGPGSHHIELAKTKEWSTTLGFGLAELKGKNPTKQLETCAKCHSHHGLVHHGFQPGDKFDDHYSLALLDTELYYPDGQVQGEAYVYGSFLQSRMFREGVRCTDCHDPHSVKLKRPGNSLCTKCHKPEKYDAPTHHFHKVGTQGAACVECHMPERHYMVVDPRRDHNIRMPRPDLSAKLGTPNACTKCHLEIKNDEPKKWPLYQNWLTAAAEGNAQAKRKIEELDQWAADVVREKFGPKRPSDPHHGPAIKAARQGAPDAEDDLVRLASSNSAGPVVKASAVALLRNYNPSPQIEKVIRKALQDDDARVRAAAVASVPHYLLARLLPAMLSDKSRLVRHEVTRMLALVPADEFPADRRAEFRKALVNLDTEQAPSADTWQVHINLGGIFSNINDEKHKDLERAERHFRKALQINNIGVPAIEGLSHILLRRNAFDEAEQLWIGHIKRVPDSFLGHYYLGLLIAENPKRLAEAAQSLKRAVEISPDFARGHYNYGLALERLKKLDEALLHYQRAYHIAPHDPAFVTALVAHFHQRGEPEKAEEVLQAAVRRKPLNDTIAVDLVGYYARQNKFDKAAEVLDDAISRKPDSPILLEYALMFSTQRGEMTKANSYARRLAATNSDNRQMQATILRSLMNFYGRTKDLKGAESALQIAIERDPTAPLILQSAMTFYGQTGNLNKARTYAKQLASVEHTGPAMKQIITLALVNFHHEIGDNAVAEMILRSALEQSPNAPALLQSAMMFYGQAGDIEKAQIYAKRLASVEHASPATQERYSLSLVTFYQKTGDNDAAEMILRKALKQSPNSPSLLQFAMTFYAQSGELRKAALCAERLIAVRPGDRAARATLQQIRQHLDRQKSSSTP